MVRERNRVVEQMEQPFLSGDDDGADEDDSVGYDDDGGTDDGADGAERHLVHLAQVADCSRAEISNQNKNSDVDGEDDSVGYDDDESADD
eukprot:5878583-Ditylum_brightwellii.AAC.1